MSEQKFPITPGIVDEEAKRLLGASGYSDDWDRLSQFSRDLLRTGAREVLLNRRRMSQYARQLPVQVSEDDITGNMWIAGRDAFVREADRFAKADRHETASAIADRAPEKIYLAMTAALSVQVKG